MTQKDKQLRKAILEQTPEQAYDNVCALPDGEQAKYARMRALIKAARAAQHPESSDELTDRIMARLADLPVAQPPSLQALSSRGLAYVFLAFAMFYCIIGAGMHIALSNATASGLPDWIWRQPRIALLTALLFGACGLLLLRRGRRAVKLLFPALAAYMLCLAINALQAQFTADITAASLGLTFGLIGYVGGGLAVCLILGGLLLRLPANGWRKAEG